jgi:hypothetical protein
MVWMGGVAHGGRRPRRDGASRRRPRRVSASIDSGRPGHGMAGGRERIAGQGGVAAASSSRPIRRMIPSGAAGMATMPGARPRAAERTESQMSLAVASRSR